MKNLYVFGNEYLEFDSMAGKVADVIKDKGINIIHCRSPEELMESGDARITILDVVKDAKEILIIDDVSKLKSRNMVSMHDFDLGFFLKLMKELDMERNIKIIGIPSAGDIKKISSEVVSWIQKEA